jgi:hypothetical protein
MRMPLAVVQLMHVKLEPGLPLSLSKKICLRGNDNEDRPTFGQRREIYARGVNWTVCGGRNRAEFGTCRGVTNWKRGNG